MPKKTENEESFNLGKYEKTIHDNFVTLSLVMGEKTRERRV